MKQEAWIKQLRDRLADHEEAAPADLWAGIEAKLAQQAAPKRPRIVPLWGRWAAAAAVLAGVIMGGGYLMQETENEQMAISTSAGQMAEVQKADDHQSVSEPEPAESGIAKWHCSEISAVCGSAEASGISCRKDGVTSDSF